MIHPPIKRQKRKAEKPSFFHSAAKGCFAEAAPLGFFNADFPASHSCFWERYSSFFCSGLQSCLLPGMYPLSERAERGEMAQAILPFQGNSPWARQRARRSDSPFPLETPFPPAKEGAAAPFLGSAPGGAERNYNHRLPGISSFPFGCGADLAASGLRQPRPAPTFCADRK